MRIEPTTEGLILNIESEDETERFGRALADCLAPGTVIGLVGPLGAGKTRLVRAIAEALGVDPGSIASPTFVLIHEYQGRIPAYHFDTYRLAGPEAFEALGPGDYWDAGGVCLVEWADRVAAVLPVDAWWVAIEPTGPDSRRLTIRMPDPARLVDRLGFDAPESGI